MWNNKLPIEKVIEAYKYCDNHNDCNNCPIHYLKKNCQNIMYENMINYLEEYRDILHKEKIDRYSFWRKEYGK